jgi:hypothetical protein
MPANRRFITDLNPRMKTVVPTGSNPTGILDAITRLMGFGPNSGPYYDIPEPTYVARGGKANKIVLRSKKKK